MEFYSTQDYSIVCLPELLKRPSHCSCFSRQADPAINHPAILHSRVLSTEGKSASDESTVCKEVVVDVDDSVCQNLINNHLH